CGLTHFHSTGDIAFGEVLLYIVQQLVRVGRGYVKCDNTFDTEGEAQYQTEQYKAHKLPVTFDEFFFQYLKARRRRSFCTILCKCLNSACQYKDHQKQHG